MSDGKDLRKEAFEMFQQGFKLVDIAKQLNVPAGTVRRWKHSDKWEMNGGTNGAGERSEKANETTHRRTFTKYLSRNAVKGFIQMCSR